MAGAAARSRPGARVVLRLERVLDHVNEGGLLVVIKRVFQGAKPGLRSSADRLSALAARFAIARWSK